MLFFAVTYEPVTFWNTSSSIILALGGILLVIGVVSGAVAYFYKGRADALIQLQREENDALKDQNTRLKEQNAQLLKEREDFIVEIKRMHTEMKTLRGLISQPKVLVSLANTIAKQHAEIIDKLTDLAAGIAKTEGEKS